MTLGNIVRPLVRPVLEIPAVQRTRARAARRAYERGGRLPWSRGYVAFRDDVVARALADPELIPRFERGEALPPAYGIALDERCVEYPWLFARLRAAPGRLLDAGSTLNHGHLVIRPELEARQLHIATLAPEDESFWELGISYLYTDLRDLPIRDDYYDEVVCASTLEHVGFDNTLYLTGRREFEKNGGTRLDALRELARVLKPGGRLLMTVPYGKRQDHGTFEQLDAAALNELLGAFPGRLGSLDFYRYSADGWQLARQDECSELEYSAETARASAERRAPEPRRLDGDRAAAARGVACAELHKD